jgi:lipoprotein NlpI
MKPSLIMQLTVAFVGMLSMGCGDDSAENRASDPAANQADSLKSLLTAARIAVDWNRGEEALDLANKAIKLDPKNADAVYYRGRAYDLLGRHKEAVADFDKAISLDPKAADAYNFRGMAHFKLGHINESIADFDKFLEMRPEATPGHWQRGISYYYAGRYDEGRKQFEGYVKVEANDVENAVWRYLCMARSVGVDKAREGLLKIKNDRRVPMMEVYALFAGKAKPADVLAAAQAGRPTAAQLNERLFYAHVYLALYYEAGGEKKLAQEHMTKAAEDHKLNHYMWDVARVHLELMRKAKG